MTWFEEFSDPRLVTLYDWWDPFRTDIGFYLDLASQRPGSVILDVGCGTGLLATQLAQRGHEVTGVDPAPAMLGVASRRPGGDLVRWIEGDAASLEETGADLALMTGHVAQIISDDGEWHATLAATHRALGPGGRLAFESRNPRARGWLTWTPELSRRRIKDAVGQEVDVWFQSVEVRDDWVRCELHYRFVSSGEEVVSHNKLRFRTEESLTASLRNAGFVVQDVFGHWDGRPLREDSPELLFVATRD
jgi:SAM-dependent methyltransferase